MSKTDNYSPGTIYVKTEGTWSFKSSDDSIAYKKIELARTNKQNASLHKWLTQIAEMLNESGQTYTTEMGIPIRYSLNLLKEFYWKPTQKVLFGIESTTEMTGVMLNNLIDSFTLWLSHKKNIEAPEFPNKQSLINDIEKKGLLK